MTSPDSTALATGFLRVHGGYRDAHSLFGDEGAPVPGAVLLGPEGQRQIVVVRQADGQELRMVERGIRAFCLRLDHSGYRAPLTLVLVSSSVREHDLEPVRRICRVLLYEEGGDLRRSLRSLLPLRLPSPITPLESAEQALHSVLGTATDDPVMRKLIKAGRSGADEVEKAVQDLVARAIHLAPEEE